MILVLVNPHINTHIAQETHAISVISDGFAHYVSLDERIVNKTGVIPMFEPHLEPHRTGFAL